MRFNVGDTVTKDGLKVRITSWPPEQADGGRWFAWEYVNSEGGDVRGVDYYQAGHPSSVTLTPVGEGDAVAHLSDLDGGERPAGDPVPVPAAADPLRDEAVGGEPTPDTEGVGGEPDADTDTDSGSGYPGVPETIG